MWDGWPLTEEAKRTLDPHTYHVDFANGQACTGGVVTTAKYRNLGFMTYGYYERHQYLRERGIMISRSVVRTNNIPTQRVNAKLLSLGPGYVPEPAI